LPDTTALVRLRARPTGKSLVDWSMIMAKDEIRVTITRSEAADRLGKIAHQLRNGSVSIGGSNVEVAKDVEFKAETKSDKLEFEVKW
jgi:hypothetical protein